VAESSKLTQRLQRAHQRIQLLQARHQIRILEQLDNKARFGRKQIAEQRQNLTENGDAWAWISGYSDVIDRFKGLDRDFLFPFSTAMDRRYGENWPFWRTWPEHARLRAASRLLWTLSPLAKGAISAITSYVIGEGMLTKVISRQDDVPEEIIQAAQAIIDHIVEHNDWLALQQEYFTRSRRDGEGLLRLWPQDDGMTLFRIVEPECVVEPPNRPREQASFGIITDPDDLNDIRGYWVSYNGIPGDGEYVHARDMIHVKENVDGIIKRGCPDFAFDTQSLYKTTTRLLENMGQGAAIQAAIAFVRQHSTATSASIDSFIDTIKDYDQTRPFTGQQENVMRMEAGTVIDMDKNQEFIKSPSAENTANYVQTVQALLRAVAVQWNAPEWIVSADSSSQNYASSLTAESPFVKTCKRFQSKYARVFKYVINYSLQHYCRVRGGLRVGSTKYPWHTLKKLIDVHVEPRTVETRNQQEESMLNKTYLEAGIKSRQTIASQLGLKWDVEERNNEEWEKKHGKQGEQGGGNPLAAMMGGGGEQPQGQQQQDTSSPDEPQGDEDFTDLEPFLTSLPEEERQSAREQALLEGRGVDKLGRIICWNEKGKRIPCNLEKSAESERDRQSAATQLNTILASPHNATPKHTADMVRLLKNLSTDEIHALKKQHGLRVGGKKAELAQKLTQAAQRILTQKQEYERQARIKGVPPAYVTGLAKQNYKLAAGYVREARQLIWAARDNYESMTGKKMRIMRANGRMDPSSIPELELIARGLKGEYPGFLNPESDDTENARVLFDLLLTGGPKLPDREQLYKDAIEQASYERQKSEDAVPFDLEGLEDDWKPDGMAGGSEEHKAGVENEEPVDSKRESQPGMPTAKDIKQRTHKLADVVGGKHAVGVEGRGGKDAAEAKRLGLYTNTINGVSLFSRTAEDAQPLEDYLRGGGKYGTLEFSRLLGYTPEEIAEYARFLQASGQDNYLAGDVGGTGEGEVVSVDNGVSGETSTPDVAPDEPKKDKAPTVKGKKIADPVNHIKSALDTNDVNAAAETLKGMSKQQVYDLYNDIFGTRPYNKTRGEMVADMEKSLPYLTYEARKARFERDTAPQPLSDQKKADLDHYYKPGGPGGTVGASGYSIMLKDGKLEQLGGYGPSTEATFDQAIVTLRDMAAQSRVSGLADVQNWKNPKTYNVTIPEQAAAELEYIRDKWYPQPKVEPEQPKPALSTTIPDNVRHTLKRSIDSLSGYQDALEAGRRTDRQFQGEGRYEWDAMVNQKIDLREPSQITTFRELAKENGVDADAVLAELGYKLPKLSEAGKVYGQDDIARRDQRGVAVADSERYAVGFTGTDALGREWINGKLKAKDETPSPSPRSTNDDDTPSTPLGTGGLSGEGEPQGSGGSGDPGNAGGSGGDTGEGGEVAPADSTEKYAGQIPSNNSGASQVDDTKQVSDGINAGNLSDEATSSPDATTPQPPSPGNFSPIEKNRGKRGILVIRGNTKPIKEKLKTRYWEFDGKTNSWNQSLVPAHADIIRNGGEEAKQFVKGLNAFMKGVLVTLDGEVVFKSKDYDAPLNEKTGKGSGSTVQSGGGGKKAEDFGLISIGDPVEFTKKIKSKTEGLTFDGREFEFDGKKYVTVQAGEPYYLDEDKAEMYGESPGWRQKHYSVQVSDFSPKKTLQIKIGEVQKEIQGNLYPSDDDRGEDNRLKRLDSLRRDLQSLKDDLMRMEKFSGKDDNGHCWDAGVMIPCPDDNNPTNEVISDESATGRNPDAGRADDVGTDAQRNAPDAGRKPSGERIVTARAELVKRADPGVVPEGLRQYLSEHQIQGVATAITAMDQHGGFLLADSTGVGKTRQQLAIAQKYASQGKKVLIVTKSEVIKPDWAKSKITGSFANDSAAMGINIKLNKGKDPITSGSIHVTTYDRLSDIKKQVDKDTVIIFDESHSLKNWGSARSKHGYEMSKAADKVMYATATPADKPLHIAHLFRAKIFGTGSWEDTYERMGMMQKEIYTPNGTITQWQIDPSVGAKEVYRRMSGLFDRMTADGLMLKREISFDGVDVKFQRVDLPPEAHEAMARVEEEVNKQGAANAGLQKALILMHQRRQQEPFKIPFAVETAQKELAEGRQVVIFASRVNESSVGGDEESGESAAVSSEGTAKLLREALEAAGVPSGDIADLHGGVTPAKRAKAVESFQQGKAKVIIATVESGGTGINLDDTSGDKPRTLIMLTPPLGAVDNMQAAGRVWRLKTQSFPRLKYIFGDTEVDDWNASLIAGKMKTLGAAVAGQTAYLDIPNLDMDAENTAELQGEAKTPVEPFDWPKLIRSPEEQAQFDAENKPVKITGNTYEYKEHIKRISNGKARFEDGSWIVPKHVADKLRDIKGLKFSDTPKPAPTPEPVKPVEVKPVVTGTSSPDVSPEPKPSLPTTKVTTSRGERHIITFSPGDSLWKARESGKLSDSVSVRKNKFSGQWEAVIWGDSPDHANEVAANLMLKGYMSPVSGFSGVDSEGREWLNGRVKGAPELPENIPVSPERKAAVHQALRLLADSDPDRATEINGIGFNKFDGDFGARLANLPELTDAQARSAIKMLAKYKRQLGELHSVIMGK